jgi:hypothetical protein
MKRFAFAQSCCTTPSAMWFWCASFLAFFGLSLLLGRVWPELQPYGDTMLLGALGAACLSTTVATARFTAVSQGRSS